jgi:hypothetical protein
MCLNGSGLASRMDAMIVGRRFIAGTYGTMSQKVPLGTTEN